MKGSIYIYIFVAFAVSYLIRVLPLTLIRKPIKNVFIRSFLYYVPYVTLSVMTFPAIVQATSSQLAGLAALAATNEAFHIDLIARLCDREEALSHAYIDFTSEYLFKNSFDHYTARANGDVLVNDKSLVLEECSFVPGICGLVSVNSARVYESRRSSVL